MAPKQPIQAFLAFRLETILVFCSGLTPRGEKGLTKNRRLLIFSDVANDKCRVFLGIVEVHFLKDIGSEPRGGGETPTSF